MNHSLYSIDRATHTKIVALALILATAVAGLGILIHSGNADGREQARISIVKAGKPAIVASGAEIAVR
jgi:hypothetical protein